MARRIALLHIGHPLPAYDDHAGALHDALAEHAELLDSAGCALAPVTSDDLERAALEMLRGHRSAGLKRRDVEGAWAHVGRRSLKGKAHRIVALPRLMAARRDQAALVVDGLTGFEVHVVVTALREEDDVADLVGTWSEQVCSSRLHVLTMDEAAAPIDLAEELAGLALVLERERIERKIDKLQKKRKKVRNKLDLLEAS